MSKDIEVIYEATPNPQSMKFRLTDRICESGAFFDDPVLSQKSPLAAKIFGFPWAAGVLIGPDFVTITKQDWVEWTVLAEPLSQLIREHLENGEPVFLDVQLKSESSDVSEQGIL